MTRREYLRKFYEMSREEKEEELVNALAWLFDHMCQRAATEDEEQERIDQIAAELLEDIDI
jgi:ribosomal protein L29